MAVIILIKGNGFYNDFLKYGLRKVSAFKKHIFFIFCAMLAYPLISKRCNIFINNFF